ncbi:MAG: thioredoxin [Paludibacteraceae bacterium]|nr:thioredoxin [Paludibacteraceae bacterium]
MTTKEFQEVVFNYKQNPNQWVYESDIPCIIDFYTTWCGPCKRLAPIMEELAVKYQGKVRFYKVDIEQERELAAVFGIRSIPTILFCPAVGKPQLAQGLLPKETLESAINSVLLPQQ